MNNSLTDEISIPDKDLLKNFNRISLSEYFFLPNILTKIAMGAILKDKIVMM